MWMKYVILRVIYGLEVLHLRKKDIAKLEAFQRCMKKYVDEVCHS